MARRKNNESIGGVEFRSTVNVFKYNAKYEGIVDGNSVQIPFFAEYRGKRFSKLVYTWHTKGKNGEKIERCIEVNGDGELGIPTTYEYDVLCALQRIFIKNKTKNGMCELIKEGYDEDYLNIDFGITELGVEMGLSKSVSNYTRDKIRKALKILMAATITSTEKGGVYDITKKNHITNKEHSFHLLESVMTTEVIDKDNDNTILKDVAKIRLSKFIYEQMCNNYKLIYNSNTVFKTKNVAARKMYHQLLQLAGDKQIAYANINYLIEKNPCKSKEPRRQKEYIKKVLKVIEESNMAKIKINKDTVIASFNKDINMLEEVTPNNQILKKYNKFKEIQAKFYELGFDMLETSMILEDLENIRYIQALLRYYDVKEQYEKIDNPKSFLNKYISNKYSIDKKYYNKECL